jgi:membrane protease YdiL (CAAX protease family)
VTVRGFFYAPSGALRAVWRIAGFIVIAYSAFRIIAVVQVRIWPGNGMLWNYSLGFTEILLAALVAHFVMLALVDRRPWSSVGLGRAQAAPRLLLGGVALGALGILLPAGVLLLSHWLSVAPSAVNGDGTWGGFALAFVAFFLPAAFSEELISRGYVFAALREGAGPAWAIVVTSLLFAALHLFNPHADAQSFALVFLAGLWLGLIVVVTGSLWAATAAHFAWNWAMAALLHAPVSGIVFPEPGYRVIDSGPDWATGGAWGPEGGAGAALGMLGGMALLIAWHRRTSPAPVLAHG